MSACTVLALFFGFSQSLKQTYSPAIIPGVINIYLHMLISYWTVKLFESRDLPFISVESVLSTVSDSS